MSFNPLLAFCAKKKKDSSKSFHPPKLSGRKKFQGLDFFGIVPFLVMTILECCDETFKTSHPRVYEECLILKKGRGQDLVERPGTEAFATKTSAKQMSASQFQRGALTPFFFWGWGPLFPTDRRARGNDKLEAFGPPRRILGPLFSLNCVVWAWARLMNDMS